MKGHQQRRVLVAGVGNVFLGDDAFGVEVAGRIDPSALPATVDVRDYGIRGVHLAYELLDGRYGSLIIVDALPVDGPPGTLAVLDASTGEAVTSTGEAVTGPGSSGAPGAAPIDGHGMTPQAVLQLLAKLGGEVDRVLVVGCRPAVLDEVMGLSEPVRAALDAAVALVCALASEQAAAIAEADAERANA